MPNESGGVTASSAGRRSPVRPVAHSRIVTGCVDSQRLRYHECPGGAAPGKAGRDAGNLGEYTVRTVRWGRGVYSNNPERGDRGFDLDVSAPTAVVTDRGGATDDPGLHRAGQCGGSNSRHRLCYGVYGLAAAQSANLAGDGHHLTARRRGEGNGTDNQLEFITRRRRIPVQPGLIARR